MNPLQEIADSISTDNVAKKKGRPAKKLNQETDSEELEHEFVEPDYEEGVLVKFNCRTTVHMIPDSEYHMEVKTLKEMRYKDYKSYQLRLAAGSPYETKNFAIGDVARIPNWYYNSHKDDVVKISIAIDRIKNKAGLRRPFNGDEAVMHGYVKDAADTMQKVKRFEKVEDNINQTEEN